MKRHLYILLLLLICHLSAAQDVQRFAECHTMGTARYVGMGGAMTAIGGDPSAVQDNPAGLGLYRSSELSISIDENFDLTQQYTNDPNQPLDSYKENRLAMPQLSLVWALGDSKRQRGLIYNNFMLSINRLANYNRNVYIKGGAMGMIPSICLLTNGLDENDLLEMPWDNVEIGWLSILGYEGYLIDPSDNKQWVPAVDMTAGDLSISEQGYLNQYTISWASNISNQWYVGVGMNIPSLSYTKYTTHNENNRINSAQLKSMFHASGVGVGASIGLIYRPMQSLRVGASIHTPTVMSLSIQTESDMQTKISSNTYEISTPREAYTIELRSPWRTSVSLAGQIGSTALIAAQYDYAHSAEMDDVHTLRLGAELQVYRGLFLNAGYVYESSFLKQEAPVGLNYNSVRGDMDYRYTPYSQYISAGFGYRGHVIIAQLAYQYRSQLLHQYATEMQISPIDVQTRTHRIVATLAWKF